MPPTSERRAEIKREAHKRASATALVCGMGDWITEAYRTANFAPGEAAILTPEERSEIMDVWNKGSGVMAWSGAFIAWLDEPKAEKDARLVRWCTAMYTVAKPPQE